MSKFDSPIAQLVAEADKIAAEVKKQRAAPECPDPYKFAVAMDDKIIRIEMPLAEIDRLTEAQLSDYVLDQMRFRPMPDVPYARRKPHGPL